MTAVSVKGVAFSLLSFNNHFFSEQSARKYEAWERDNVTKQMWENYQQQGCPVAI